MGDEDNSDARYRDWGILQYVFRGIEKFAPWVRRIHFITCNQRPQWLNVDNPKLHLVNHEDIIPHDCLPTFSSRPIEFNMHRIEGLSERFIHFNDDYFLISHVRKEDFFRNGLPCDMAVFNATAPLSPRAHVLLNDGNVIYRHFPYKQMLKKNWNKIFTFKYGSYLFRTLCLAGYPYFLGFFRTHAPQPYLKSTIETLWEEEPELMNATIHSRFRDTKDLNIELFRWWQLASGQFVPSNTKKMVCFRVLNDKYINSAINIIRHQKCKVIILNDDSNDITDFEDMKLRLKAALDEILPEKSSFEK